MKKSFLSFVVDQLSKLPPAEIVDLSGKTVVVVGANAGIGFEATRHFARMNPAKLVLACRSEDRGRAAGSEIERTTGFRAWKVWRVDLADFASVMRFTERFERECDRLDILVMNAAIVARQFNVTTDGWESCLQVNHLGTALSSLLLLPRLVETGRKFGSTSRLVIVASEVHYWATLSEDVKTASNPVGTLNGPNYRDIFSVSMERRYFETKLMNVLFARALHDRLQSITPLTVNTVNPGLCYSGLRNDLGSIRLRIVNFFLETCLARTSEQGSRQLVYAAVGEQGNEDHMKGAYINRAAVSEPSDFVISEEGKTMQDNLWSETIEILTKLAPNITTIVQEYLV